MNSRDRAENNLVDKVNRIWLTWCGEVGEREGGGKVSVGISAERED